MMKEMNEGGLLDLKTAEHKLLYVCIYIQCFIVSHENIVLCSDLI